MSGASHEVICAVLSYLISEHKYGTPVDKQTIVNRSAIRSDQEGEAKDAYDELQNNSPFIEEDDNGNGIKIDNSEFGLLADYLYVRCDDKWDAESIHRRLKHYEGWNEHEWSPSDGD